MEGLELFLAVLGEVVFLGDSINTPWGSQSFYGMPFTGSSNASGSAHVFGGNPLESAFSPGGINPYLVNFFFRAALLGQLMVPVAAMLLGVPLSLG